MRRQATGWEVIFVIHAFNGGLKSRIYRRRKNVYKSLRNNVDVPREKFKNDLNSHFILKNIQKANEHLKMCSSSWKFKLMPQ